MTDFISSMVMYQAEGRKYPDGIWLALNHWQPTKELAEKQVHHQKKQYPTFEYRILKITHTTELVS